MPGAAPGRGAGNVRQEESAASIAVRKRRAGKAMSGVKIGEVIVGALILTFVGLLFYWFSFPENALQRLCSFEYRIPRSRVRVQLRPEDCNFFHEPYGLKRCGYLVVVASHFVGKDQYVDVRWARDDPQKW